MAKEKTNRFILLLIAFWEGATVMACELFGAKMIAPFFGTTIYSWAGVLAITLGGLAAGYYFGGWLTTKYKPIKLLNIILISSGAFMLLMPFISNGIMTAAINMNILSGLILSLIVFLFPPIVFFGMVSPVIIHALVSSVDATGKTAGRVYAISTVGGVLNTLFLGFYIIPEFGIKIPTLIYGAIILLLPVLLIQKKRKIPTALVLIFALAIVIGVQTKASENKERQMFNISYSSEGLLGQVKVMDYGWKDDNFGFMPLRGLLVNNTWQTVINSNDMTGMLDYIYFMRPLFSAYTKKSEVLLIGLGGGTLCKEIQKKNLNVEVVEIDKRLKEISHRFFGLDRKTNIIIDDGRHYLNKTKKKYDIIVFDAFLGENPPWHLLTLQSFERVKELLNPEGSLFIEFYGYIEGETGLSGRSVYRTLIEAGFKTEIIATSAEDGIERNFIYVASENDFDFNGLDYSGIKYTDKKIDDLNNFLLNTSEIDFANAVTLTDDCPALEKMLMNPALDWRKSLNKLFRNNLIEQKQPIYY
ncbi:MAG: fused MFS/spermidine synthase [Saprospiraceae bacterium]|nr:fused MFS/spermidine synthase [Saprospiraceae bacterium]